MNNPENTFFETCRVIVANELDIPPDNIDMDSICLIDHAKLRYSYFSYFMIDNKLLAKP